MFFTIFPINCILETGYTIQGMDITFVTSAREDKEAMSLLKAFGFPFKNQNNLQIWQKNQ